MKLASGDAASRFAHCAEWLVQGPYNTHILESRGRGDLLLARGRQPPGHYPDPAFSNYSLIITTLGQCLATVDVGEGRRSVTISTGSMIVAPVDIACDYEKNGPVETLVVGLSRSKVLSLSQQTSGRPVTNLGPCHDHFRDGVIQVLCERLWAEVVDENPYGELFIDQVIGSIIAALLVRSGGRREQQSQIRGLPPRKLAQVTDYIMANLREKISLSELAAVAHLSEFHFARSFKRSTGLPPHQFVLNLRIERACGLIRGGELPLAQIAFEVGFSSQSHMARHFKRIFGSGPSSLRK